MKCYKCGSFLYDGEFCSTCGADVTVYREIVLKSNDFYNSGLEYARDRNLSKAIEHLNLSLKLYKGNINSHNLLGLVYFETGEYTLGFAHWVISKNIQPENNLANMFLDLVQEDKAYFDSINSNIKKYNKAISYVEQESYDLAEIQLKKILNDNTVHMVKAYQLSALLRIRKKKYAAARKILERAQAIDAGDPTTIAYMTAVNSQIKNEEKDLTPGELKTKHLQENAEEDLHSPLSGDDVIIPKSSYKEYNPTTVAIIQILIGFIVGAALIFFVVVPAKTNSIRNEAAATQSGLEAQIAQLTEENARLSTPAVTEPESQAAQDEAASGSAEPQTTSEEDARKEETAKKDEALLLEAYAAYQDGDIETSGNKLLEITDASVFDAGNKAIYDAISYTKDVVPDYWYNGAVRLFEENNFEEALKEFTRVYEVANTTGESLYYMGLCHYNLDQYEEATARFQEYLDTFPEGPHVNECEYLIVQMS
ncbi:MAG: tetratricopeptide repeat protein [Parasporobacterium sp.]|nr:tetratricopeptide repeat protein [Parasporobacterium sp.]